MIKTFIQTGDPHRKVTNRAIELYNCLSPIMLRQENIDLLSVLDALYMKASAYERELLKNNKSVFEV